MTTELNPQCSPSYDDGIGTDGRRMTTESNPQCSSSYDDGFGNDGRSMTESNLCCSSSYDDGFVYFDDPPDSDSESDSLMESESFTSIEQFILDSFGPPRDRPFGSGFIPQHSVHATPATRSHPAQFSPVVHGWSDPDSTWFSTHMSFHAAFLTFATWFTIDSPTYLNPVP